MLKHACVALLAIFVSFGVTAKPNPLPMPLAERLPVEVVFDQQELATDVDGIGMGIASQGGLLTALIGYGIHDAQVKSAEKAIVPLRDALLGYRFDELMEATLRDRLANAPGISPHPELTFMKSGWDAQETQTNQGAPPTALVLVPRYSIDNGFEHLAVSLSAQLVSRTVKPNGKIKTRYEFSRTYSFQYSLVEGEEENIDRWKKMRPERLRAMLDAGMKHAADMLVHDFSEAGRGEWEQSTRRQYVTVKGQEYDGLAVRQTQDWAWARVGKGPLQALTGYQPVSEMEPGIAPSSTETPAVIDPSIVTTPAAQQ